MCALAFRVLVCAPEVTHQPFAVVLPRTPILRPAVSWYMRQAEAQDVVTPEGVFHQSVEALWADVRDRLMGTIPHLSVKYTHRLQFRHDFLVRFLGGPAAVLSVVPSI